MPLPGYTVPKRDFIGKPAPPGYVAGVGRGATGFTTRSDIGPARDPIAGPSGEARKRPREDDEDNEELNESNFDEFYGYGGSLFAKDPYDSDDEEADRVYSEIDKIMADKGQAHRERKRQRELKEQQTRQPTLREEFSDLRERLKEVTEEEWMSIPEVGDSRNRKKRLQREDKYTPIPDSLLADRARLASGGEKLGYLEDDESESKHPGSIKEEPEATLGDAFEIRARKLNQAMDRAAEQVKKSDTNAAEYLRQLDTWVPKFKLESRSVMEEREKWAKLRQRNPHIPEIWLASAKLEEDCGKLSRAREYIVEGCTNNPDNADLLQEAVRLLPPDLAKKLKVDALRSLGRDVERWISFAEKKDDISWRRSVFLKARQLMPEEPIFWKKSVTLEKPEEARVMLREAVRHCDDDVDLWLALARVEPYEEANRVLARASERHPTDRRIWLTASKLQESVGKTNLVSNIVKRCIEELSRKDVEIIKEEWLAEAKNASTRFPITSREITRHIEEYFNK